MNRLRRWLRCALRGHRLSWCGHSFNWYIRAHCVWCQPRCVDCGVPGDVAYKGKLRW